MSQDRKATRQPSPGRRRACRAALLALTAVLTVLAVASGGSQRALAASPASAGATAATIARLAPATPSPSPSPVPAPAAGTGTGGCGFLDVTCYVSSAITSWFASLVKSAVNPLLALIGQSALSTPQPGAIPAVRTIWATSVAVADACYVLLVLLGAIVVMSHETLQTSYSAKEIAPRREAMLALVDDGLMEAVPNKGFRTVPLTPADLAEIYEMRLLLEVPAVARPARGDLPGDRAARRDRADRQEPRPGRQPGRRPRLPPDPAGSRGQRPACQYRRPVARPDPPAQPARD
jgi:hypothetical protein